MVFGILSIGLAAVFVIRQADYKRMLAYSSVEHMGILALGVGIGGAATFGSMFHAVNHSLAKAALFLVAGNILAGYHTTSVRGVRGALRVLPVSGALWVAGFFAITGTPPFGSFYSEFTILQAAFTRGPGIVAWLYLGLLVVAFMGMGLAMLSMAQGEPWGHHLDRRREPVLSIVPVVVLLAGALALGFYIPSGLEHLLRDAATILGGGPLAP